MAKINFIYFYYFFFKLLLFIFDIYNTVKKPYVIFDDKNASKKITK